MSGIVNALWVGPGGLRLDDGTQLVPGETVVKIPKGEAEASDNWQPVAGKTSRKNAGGDE